MLLFYEALNEPGLSPKQVSDKVGACSNQASCPFAYRAANANRSLMLSRANLSTSLVPFRTVPLPCAADRMKCYSRRRGGEGVVAGLESAAKELGLGPMSRPSS